MKIILSRKGFDTSSGGVPSPILPSGEMLSLPIPYDFSPTTFGEITWQRAGDIGEMIESLTRREVRSRDRCHLDPDLRRNALQRVSNWQPAFGQMGSEQSHLRERGVTNGDLFLFFGLFRQARRLNTGWQYVPGSPRIHVVYGWLQVGQILSIDDRHAILNEFPWLREHPHINHLDRWKGENVIYLPTNRLSISVGNHLPGAGLLEFDERQVLTAEPERRKNGRVSYWDIRPWSGDLGNRNLSRFNKEKNLLNGSLLKTAGRWQELVIDTLHYPEAENWAKGLFSIHT